MPETVILTLNAGSSSLKIAVYPRTGGKPIATGLVDRIGADGSLSLRGETRGELCHAALGPDAFGTHDLALRTALDVLEDAFPGLPVAAVGHRVVHGGMDFAAPVAVDATVLARIEALSPFAPLHQPHNIKGIRAAMAAFPDAVQVACFDTAFHRGHDFVHDTYALPHGYYDKGIRRYGFHGLSYAAIAGALAAEAPGPAHGRVIVAHLGNGASLCGMQAGRSVASTMGFTALDGLPMGTRSGQIDPGVLLYLIQQDGLDAAGVADLLYRRSGLLGLSGVSADMRALEASPEPRAAQAIGYFTTRIRHEIGALAADLGGLDMLVFTAGIGEHSARVRGEVCDGLGWLGIALDADANRAHAQRISTPASAVEVRVMATDEEGVIAAAARGMLGQQG